MQQGGTSQDREAPALVLSAFPLGEVNARVHVLTEENGLVHGVAYGARSRAGSALWQPGNVVKTRFQTRGAGTMPRLSGEMLYGCGFRLLDAPLALSMMQSVCVLADTALPEGEPCPALFAPTLKLLTFLGMDPAVSQQEGLPHVVRWELALLADLGFGLDLSCCAVTGAREGLAYVSPRTGKAVTEEGAGEWKNRLLPLPAFLLSDEETGTKQDWLAGLRLTSYFLARDAYGQRHRPMPAARERLEERVARLADAEEKAETLVEHDQPPEKNANPSE
ncbi:DNA repair protein RecO [Acetobacter tropicalis NRIC 0312]|uniref:DNA repair protein RecO n=1 Tax=Acetobacter tropicalis TaxID=104102 RepID=A0A511FN98_9PROT|nr:DNA repair protein RecO [Acetobacter tropicalis]KXV49755.1 DNA recombination protein RecO [Acetobacter tropicalis]GAL97920.1 DNA repair protein RecO [Acetobacter tropicalis]GBR70938.1 DNA repair protein RecO [Acetobacter tropicalis NRIC 0312]GEL50421.1 DNA repair protein RecO [Acetobacter tropicalis]